MKCPVCSSSTLKPIKLNPGLPARECRKCNGILVDLLSYREWAERKSATSIPENRPAAKQVEDNSKTLTCPKCSKMMLKFRMSGSTTNRVDVCLHCDDAWLDYGEWELLGDLALQEQLTSIFTEPWQRNIREEEKFKVREQRFKTLFGESDYQKLVETKKWIDDHEQKEPMIRFLLNE